MEQPLRQQPALVKSVTDDDDSREDQNSVSHECMPNSDTQDTRDAYLDTAALAYLLRYETMARQQDAEDMATLAHVRPLLERIELLGRHPDDVVESSSESRDASRLLERQVSYEVLGRALEALEDSSEVMTTDRQLMMVLRTLTGKDSTPEESITWAELLQCYKTIVGGMQTLHHLPASSKIRSRARDRTLLMLSLFEPPSMKLFNEDIPHKIDTEDTLFNRYDVPDKEEREVSAETKSKSRTSTRVLFGVAVVLAACAIAALNTSIISKLVPKSQMEDQLTSVFEAQTQAEGAGGDKLLTEPLFDSSPLDQIDRSAKNPRLDGPRAMRMNPSRAARRDMLDRLSIAKLSQEDQELMLTSLLKENMALGATTTKRMGVYALLGGAGGMALAPTMWKGMGALLPALRGLLAMAVAQTGLGAFALVSAVTVGTLAFAATVIKGIRMLAVRVARSVDTGSME